MTDDPTQQYPTPAGDAPAPGAPGPDMAPAPDATPAPDMAGPAAGATAAAGAAAVPVAAAGAAGASRARWVAALGIAGVVLVAGVAALLLFGKPSTPEALTYIPGDAALVMELRPDLPGDQMQAAGNLLAHFPGFQDQSTLADKIDLALKRIIAEAPGSSVDYEKDVKPFLGGPIFVGVHSFEDVMTSDEPANVVVVATTNGAVSCDPTMNGQPVTTETYNGLQLSIATGSKEACVIDGRFAIAGDVTGVKAAIDTRKASTGMDKSARYQEARKQLGLERLATMYVDGTALAKAVPSTTPGAAVSDFEGMIPQWFIAGLRAESDALVMDMVVAPPANPAALPSAATMPPAHPIAFTAFAPAGTLAYAEIQGFGVGVHNLVSQLQSDPQFSESLKALDSFGGLDGVIGWIEDAGLIVFKDGDTPAGGIVLAAKDAAAASEKVAALSTVLALGGAGGGLEVSTSTIEGIKVTTVHIDDISTLSGAVGGGTEVPAVPLDLSIAAKDRFVVIGVGTTAMQQMLGVKAGSGLADDAAFKRALTRALPNPQVLAYVAAGATIDWIETAGAALGAPPMTADVKAYVDPIDGVIFTTAGDPQRGGSLRLSLTVAP